MRWLAFRILAMGFIFLQISVATAISNDHSFDLAKPPVDPCDDGNPCNGVEFFHNIHGCIAGPSPGSFTEIQKLLADSPGINGQFGYSISVSGENAIVGAPRADSTGVAYFYQFNGTSWIQRQKLTATDGEPGEWFGSSVSLSGEAAIIGAQLDDDAGSSSGSAYIFRFDGANWIQAGRVALSINSLSDQ